MKKLKYKVFTVIFLILTLFLLTILCITNYQNYNTQIENIKKTIFRMDETKNRNLGVGNLSNRIKPVAPVGMGNEQPKIFMDSFIYTVRLDESNNIVEIINHTPDDVSKETIEQMAKEILKQKNADDYKISNLFFNNYSYIRLKSPKALIIMDNTNARNVVMQGLKTSIIIFILLEIVIVYISRKLTAWIIKPVVETFNKQKQFIEDASHELKTPLAVVIASSEALENNPGEGKWLDNIKSEAERMNNLITELLEMAKSEHGVKEQYAEENISKIIEKGVLTFESLIYEKSIKLDYNIQENIFLLCSSNQIKQLVSILIDNAIRHCTSKGNIIIKLKKEKGNIVFEVTNQGEEIPKEEREKIFERFYRADEARNRAENRYGLGLAIAKNIVTNHNGTIQVNCENGYTTFRATIKQ